MSNYSYPHKYSDREFSDADPRVFHLTSLLRRQLPLATRADKPTGRRQEKLFKKACYRLDFFFGYWTLQPHF